VGVAKLSIKASQKHDGAASKTVGPFVQSSSESKQLGHPILNVVFHPAARGVVELTRHGVHGVGSVQNVPTQILCFLATHDLILLLVSDLVWCLPAPILI
jgi:hypothetical protein